MQFDIPRAARTERPPKSFASDRGGLFRYRTEFFGRPVLPAWARLGPLSTSAGFDTGISYRRLLATVSAASAHPTGWHGGDPTGRPWDFAVKALRELLRARLPSLSCRRPRRVGQTGSFPDPIPRIKSASHAVGDKLGEPWVRRSGCREGFPSAGRCVTLGDSNPDRPSAPLGAD